MGERDLGLPIGCNLNPADLCRLGRLCRVLSHSGPRRVKDDYCTVKPTTPLLMENYSERSRYQLCKVGHSLNSIAQ
jgi:hypothetical protein